MSIDIDYINPVIGGLEEVFSTMLNCKVERVGLGLMENNQALHPVSGIIGVGGRGVGTIVLSMSETVALRAASVMLMTELSEIDDEVMDAVGELTNMVGGRAKVQLERFQLSMSLPNVLCGTNCRLHFPQNAHPISIPFKCLWGLLALQIGFSFSTAKK
ncbi:MAG: chemotaxis protein CheX [Thermoguttaceae bacterium]